MKNKKRLKDPIIINGCGDSLWADKERWNTKGNSSKGPFSVSQWIVYELDMEEGDGNEPYELQLFGPDTEWFHYTDKQISKEVNEKFLPIVAAAFPLFKIDSIGWSEQGMQPEKGWSFDICAEKIR